MSEEIEMDDFEVFTPEIEPKKTKKAKPAQTGINWIFPLLSCKYGNVDTSSECKCDIESTAFWSDEPCMIQDEKDPKAPPKLCPSYIPKDK